MNGDTWNEWHAIWWNIAIRPWLDDARTELLKLLPLGDDADEADYEDLARTVAFECQPIYVTDILALAEIYPPIWEYACDSLSDDLGWGPGTEIDALQAGIAYWMFYDLLDLLPDT